MKPDSRRNNQRGTWISTQLSANFAVLSLGASPGDAQMGNSGSYSIIWNNCCRSERIQAVSKGQLPEGFRLESCVVREDAVSWGAMKFPRVDTSRRLGSCL